VVSRRSQWTTKHSSLASADKVWTPISEGITPETKWPQIKSQVKKSLSQDINELWKSKIQALLVQGAFPALLVEQNECVTWKSIMYNLPRGVLQFAIKASMDSLPSFCNLRRWGKRLHDLCPLCKNKGTLHHILNHCPEQLDRYLWRHNSIISYLIEVITSSQEFIDQNMDLYADLDGWTINGQTIPPDILQCNSKPDIVIVNRQSHEIILIELTVPFETNIEQAATRKCNKYEPLIHDFSLVQYKCSVITLEIGSHGLIDKCNQSKLNSLSSQFKTMQKHKDIVHTCSKISLLASFIIFCAKVEPAWTNPAFIKF